MDPNRMVTSNIFVKCLEPPNDLNIKMYTMKEKAAGKAAG